MPKKTDQPRKKAKPKKPRKLRREIPRTWRKDERGIPFTADQKPFAILPSDLLPAVRQPPSAPTKATRKIEGDKPTTVIPELKAIEFTQFAFETVIEAIQAADKVQIKKMNPTGGPNLRYRIELAAAFLSHVMIHAYDAALANKNPEPMEFMYLALNIAIRRAEEIYGQDGA